MFRFCVVCCWTIAVSVASFAAFNLSKHEITSVIWSKCNIRKFTFLLHSSLISNTMNLPTTRTIKGTDFMLLCVQSLLKFFDRANIEVVTKWQHNAIEYFWYLVRVVDKAEHIVNGIISTHLINLIPNRMESSRLARNFECTID